MTPQNPRLAATAGEMLHLYNISFVLHLVTNYINGQKCPAHE